MTFLIAVGRYFHALRLHRAVPGRRGRPTGHQGEGGNVYFWSCRMVSDTERSPSGASSFAVNGG
ncbi:hypothetical protein FHS29_006647 [Saccharothrix tamanrassetensis]|uniref:Uncharacterized protein n=1 Tax=Saccharothrix tamanrassetensis TaxID=1051531 RepID=A0A841CVP3_9PSEU|nr:hypothetical protein [Saccharothrix tamanrassetensis]